MACGLLFGEYGDLVGRVFAQIDHARVEDQVLALDAPEDALHHWRLLEVVAGHLGRVGLHRVTDFQHVGITRASQIPTRWLDQGASQALPIFRVATRQQSGLVEDLLRTQVADKTNWRALLKGDAVPLDLPAIRDQLLESCAEGIAALQQRFGLQAIQPVGDAEVVEIRYPVEAYPTKVASHDLEKTPVVEGILRGIKGQYLILDTGVINLRKYTAYQVAVLTE